MAKLEKEVAESSTFKSLSALTISVREQRIAGTAISRAYILENTPRWYHDGTKRAVMQQAKRARKHLAQSLPQEKVWICPVYPKVDGSRTHEGYIAVWHGLPAKGNLFATETKDLVKRRGQWAKLYAFDSFNIICALPCSLRIRLLCSFDRSTSEDDAEKDEVQGTPSVRSDECARYSEETLDAVQFSLEEDLCHEIKTYLDQGPLMNNIS